VSVVNMKPRKETLKDNRRTHLRGARDRSAKNTRETKGLPGTQKAGRIPELRRT